LAGARLALIAGDDRPRLDIWPFLGDRDTVILIAVGRLTFRSPRHGTVKGLSVRGNSPAARRVRANAPPQAPGGRGSAGSRWRLGLWGAGAMPSGGPTQAFTGILCEAN
jgi:hypothetical protein